MQQLGELVPARDICRKILRRHPKHAQTLVVLAGILQQGGQNNQAIKLVRQAMALGDKGATSHDVLRHGLSGGHSIQTAQRFPQARVLAIDMSLASLAYARRKSREIGLPKIEYAQADILELGSIERRFDVIESVGVLHHLSNPAAGLNVLTSLLRPGGLMLVGLYSALARRSENAAREYLAQWGYRPTVDYIRAGRQELIRRGNARALPISSQLAVAEI